MIATAQRKVSADRDEEYSRALERLEAKQRVVASLLARRIGLLEAAWEFRLLTQAVCSDPDTKQNGETICRAVIGWAHLALRDQPERAEAVSVELEAELSDHLRRFGVVRFSHG